MRRGGRVSNLVKTLEQGAKQRNKINSYFSKFGDGCEIGRERGHSLAAAKLCVGVKRRVQDYCEESENDSNVGSAKKRPRVTK